MTRFLITIILSFILLSINLITLAQMSDNDIGIQTVIEPEYSLIYSDEEHITVKIYNYGNVAQSNFDVSFSINGSGFIFESVDTTLAPQTSLDFTFSSTVNMSEVAEYSIEVCTNLPGDESPENNCLAEYYIVPWYCIPHYTSGCAWGDGFDDFALEQIVNLNSGCADLDGVGYSKYLELGPAVLYMGYEFIISIVTAYDNNYTTVWVDWNQDMVLAPEEILIDNFVMVESGILYEVPFSIPDTIEPGYYYLRARTNWNDPCNDPHNEYAYGEAEDYIIQVKEGTYLPIPKYLQVEKETDNDLYLYWEEPNLITKELLGYNIFENDNMIGSTTEEEFYIYDLIPGPYEYYVTAVYDEGESEASNKIEVEIILPPPPPVLTVEYQEPNIVLNWDAWTYGMDTALYNIYYSYEEGAWQFFDMVGDTFYYNNPGIIGLHCYMISVTSAWPDPVYSNEACEVISFTIENEVENVYIYPNPVKDLINISSPEQIESIEIFNGNGLRVLKQNPQQNNFQLSVSEFPPGIYLIKLRTSQQEVIRKVIIE